MLGHDCCDEIDHRAYCRGLAKVAVNHDPDVAREGRDVLLDSDEIALSVPEKARQASHAYSGPHGHQVLADVVQFASHGTIAGDAEEPALLRHFGIGLIEGDELPPLRRGQMRIGPVRIEAEGHFPDLPRHAARFTRPHEPHGDIGFTTA